MGDRRSQRDPEHRSLQATREHAVAVPIAATSATRVDMAPSLGPRRGTRAACEVLDHP